MSGEDDDLLFLFEYSAEENCQLSFRNRLEQERSQRGISQSEWMLKVFCFDHNGVHLDMRYDPWGGQFPVTVKLRTPGLSCRLADPQQNAIDRNIEEGTSTLSSIHAQSCSTHPPMRDGYGHPPSGIRLRTQHSDPVDVAVYVIDVGRGDRNYRNALWASRAINQVLVELPGPGAKLIVQPENRPRILDFFRRRAHVVQSRRLYLDDMKHWHVIVEDVFVEIVDRVLSEIPSSKRVEPTWSFPIPVVDLTEESNASSANHSSVNTASPHHASSSFSSMLGTSTAIVNTAADNTIAYQNRQVPSERPRTKCNICGASFVSEEHLLRHVHDNHTGDLAPHNQHTSSSSSSMALFGVGKSSAHDSDNVIAQSQAASSSSTLGVLAEVVTPSSNQQISENHPTHSDINKPSLPPHPDENQKRLKIIDDETQIDETDIDDDDDDNEDIDATVTIQTDQGNDNAMQKNNIPHKWINSVETRPVVLEKTFVSIPPLTISEGRQTVSTNQGGRAPRRQMPPLPKSSGPPASTSEFVSAEWSHTHYDTPSSWTDSSMSMLDSVPSEAQSLETPSQAQSDMGDLSLQRRLDIMPEKE